MKVEIRNLDSGKYNLNGLLFFNCKGVDVEMDKVSALEIMATLLDSESMRTSEAERLLEKLDERIGKGI